MKKKDDKNYFLLEKYYYESKPYLIGLIALYSLANRQNKILLYCGLVLAFCSLYIFITRFLNRK